MTESGDWSKYLLSTKVINMPAQSTLVLGANSLRKSFSISMNGTGLAYLSPERSSDSSLVIRVGPGESLEDDEPNCYRGEIYAYGTVATDTLNVIEKAERSETQ